MSQQTVPSKCSHCDKPMSAPLVCDFCHSLNPAGLMTDYFALMGLPRRFDLDEDVLRQKFFALNRHVHPDKHEDESPEVRQLSLAMSAAVNDAFRTLKDPATRAGYLLELHGGKSSAADKSVPDGFLETMMMMQEELADAKAAGNTAVIARLKEVLQNQHDGLIRRITALFGDYEESVACEAVRTDLLGEIRQQLNAVSYVRKLLSQVG
ncbi:MAG: Fe-S protein assembly co-chaperone HscB [Phycisphaerae bacterium]